MNGIKLYKPVIERKEIDNSHFYWVDGEFKPGVTRILEFAPVEFGLKEFWKTNTKEDSERILELAGLRGSAIHNACERLMRGEELKLTEEFKKNSDKKAIVGFVNWCAEYNPKIEELEQTVASEFGYAGTLDIKCKINGEDWIIDIKTSRAIQKSHFLQILAYKQAYLEMTGINCKTGILHLNPLTKKGWTFHTRMGSKEYEFEIMDFMHIYEIYKSYNDGKIEEPPEVDRYPELLSLTHNSNELE